MSNKWMFSGSFTLQDQKNHWEDEAILNPQNMWAINDKYYAPGLGGNSGKGINANVFSTWLVKLSGLYQLPLDFNASFTFNARQGHIIPWTVGIVDYDGALSSYQNSSTVYLQEWGKLRLPTFWNLNFRLEKIISAGDSGKIYMMADLFNVFNSAIMNRRYDKHHGTYYIHNGYFAPNATDFQGYEVLNPRVLRFGIRFQF
jgi:hypothetical protein